MQSMQTLLIVLLIRQFCLLNNFKNKNDSGRQIGRWQIDIDKRLIDIYLINNRRLVKTVITDDAQINDRQMIYILKIGTKTEVIDRWIGRQTDDMIDSRAMYKYLKLN